MLSYDTSSMFSTDLQNVFHRIINGKCMFSGIAIH